MDEKNECIPDAAVLLKLAKVRMPFGKYKKRRLIDLPEPYLVWFSQKGFPSGKWSGKWDVHKIIKCLIT